MRRGPRRPGRGARKRSAEARSASSGSTFSLRATLTAANSTSPTSWKASSRSAGGLQLVQLGAHGVERDVVEVEARGGRAALHLARVERPREVLRHLAEDPRLAPGLGRLDRVPVAQHLAGRLRLHRRRRRADGGGRASGGSARPPRPATPPRAPRAAGRGSGPGRARRPARRAAWRRRRRGRRRRARRPPRRCGGRSSARPARGPTGTRAAGGG